MLSDDPTTPDADLPYVVFCCATCGAAVTPPLARLRDPSRVCQRPWGDPFPAHRYWMSPERGETGWHPFTGLVAGEVLVNRGDFLFPSTPGPVACRRGHLVGDIRTCPCKSQIPVALYPTSVVAVAPERLPAWAGGGAAGDGRSIGAGLLRVWDLRRGTVLGGIDGSPGDSVAAITPDGRWALSKSDDDFTALTIWDVERGTELHRLGGHSRGVGAVALTPDEARVIAASGDHTLKVWDLERGAQLCTLAGHSDLVKAVAVTRDGTRVVSGSWDRTLRVWDLKSGAELQRLVGCFAVDAVAITPDGTRVVSGSADGTLQVWSLEHGTALHRLAEHHEEPDRYVRDDSSDTPFQNHFDGFLREDGGWDRLGEPNFWAPLAITPDGRRAISGLADGTRVWDLERGAKLHRLGPAVYYVYAVAVTPDVTRVVTSLDGALTVWDLESGTLLRTLGAHYHKAEAVALTPDGTRLVSGAPDGTVKVWDLEHGTEIHTLEGYSRWVTLMVTPDGKRVIAGSEPR